MLRGNSQRKNTDACIKTLHLLNFSKISNINHDFLRTPLYFFMKRQF